MKIKTTDYDTTRLYTMRATIYIDENNKFTTKCEGQVPFGKVVKCPTKNSIELEIEIFTEIFKIKFNEDE